MANLAAVTTDNSTTLEPTETRMRYAMHALHFACAAATMVAAMLLTYAVAQAATVDSVSAPNGAHHVRDGAPLTARFDRDMAAPSAGTFVVKSSQGAARSGTFSGANTDTLRFTSSTPWHAGDMVECTLTGSLLDTGGVQLSRAHVSRYRVAAGRGPADFSSVVLCPTSMSNSGPSGKLADMNNDGWLDYVRDTYSTIAIHYNNGGSFNANGVVLNSPNCGSNDFVVVDINNDGLLDIVRSALAQGRKTHYWLQTQPGVFTGPTEFGWDSGGGAYGATNVVGYPQRVAAGDVNGDGFSDIIVGTNGISMLYLNQSGTGFIDGPALLPGPMLCCELADIDNDGDLDFIYGEMGRGFVAKNNGQGAFSISGGLGTNGVRHACVDVGDLNGDGFVDIVFGHSGNGGPPLVHWNNGNGQFFTSTPLGSRIENVYTIDVADMNGDGHLDVICGDDAVFFQYLPAQLFMNDGTGGFSHVVSVGGSPHQGFWQAPIWGTTGDIDNDGDIDYVGTSNSFRTSIWPNGDTGMRLTMTSPQAGNSSATGSVFTAAFSQPPAQPAPGAMVARSGLSGSLQGPVSVGGATLALQSAGQLLANDEIEISLTNGLTGVNCGFNGPYVYRFRTAAAAAPAHFTDVMTDLPGSSGALLVTAGDFDNDARMDVIEVGTSVRLYMGGASGLSGSGSQAVVAATAIAVADINADGHADLVAVHDGGQNAVHLWDPSACDFTGGTIPFGSGTDRSVCVAFADMNGDGHVDIIVGNLGEQDAVHLNDGTGSLAQCIAFGAAQGDTRSIAVADLDGDGAMDVLTGDDNGDVAANFNTGNGRLPLRRTVVSTGAPVVAIAAGDFDGDRMADLTIGVTGGQDLVMLNDASGRFPRSTALGAATSATCALALGDVNGDGRLDLLCSDSAGDATVYLNTGSGFAVQASLPGASGTGMLLDLDADGDLDVLRTRPGHPTQACLNVELPRVEFSVAATYAAESAGTVSIAVSLSNAFMQDVSVDCACVGGTASNGSDWSVPVGTVTIPAGSTTASLAVVLHDDGVHESDETVLFQLTNVMNGLIGQQHATTLYILDNDGPPNVRLSAPAYSVSEGGTIDICIELSTTSGLDVQVDYSTINGSAASPADYTQASGTVVIPAGATGVYVSIVAIDDVVHEGDEQFTIQLSNPVNAGMGLLSSADVTITDNDAVPTVGFATSAGRTSESAGSAVVVVTLSNPTTQVVSVDYATASGTATGGHDYTSASGSVIFAPGETSAQVIIAINDDLLPEPDEDFFVSLAGAVNAQPSLALHTMTIEADLNDIVQVGTPKSKGSGGGCAAGAGVGAAPCLLLLLMWRRKRRA